MIKFNKKGKNAFSSCRHLQMLRTMKGYDEYNTILLPPRQPGGKLPQEVIDAFNEQQRKKEAEEKEKAAAAAAAAAQAEKVAEVGGESVGLPVIATVPPSTSLSRDVGRAGSDVGEGVKDGKEIRRLCVLGNRFNSDHHVSGRSSHRNRVNGKNS